MLTQQIIDNTVKIATKSALAGKTLARVIWIPPTRATDDHRGSFALVPCKPPTASGMAPWDE